MGGGESVGEDDVGVVVGHDLKHHLQRARHSHRLADGDVVVVVGGVDGRRHSGRWCADSRGEVAGGRAGLECVCTRGEARMGADELHARRHSRNTGSSSLARPPWRTRMSHGAFEPLGSFVAMAAHVAPLSMHTRRTRRSGQARCSLRSVRSTRTDKPCCSWAPWSTCRPSSAGNALGTGRSGFPLQAHEALRSGRPGLALRSLITRRSVRARWAGRAVHAGTVVPHDAGARMMPGVEQLLQGLEPAVCLGHSRRHTVKIALDISCLLSRELDQVLHVGRE
mmetsp:Transcript_40747/g.88134  ORF Transcript_40747/g.88134 Transcript_40747/m.88134 type:complete len:281 (+) Transcript_40747:327-1169(+)